MAKNAKLLMWLGIFLILVVGLVHVMDAKDSFNDAIYKGWLFYANGLASVVVAWGLFQKKEWGWYLGMMVAVGSLGAYIASRTVGLPLIPAEPDAWFEPLGVASMISESLFIVVFTLNKVAQ